MSIIPDFEIGLWNAWLGMLILLIPSNFPLIIKSEAGKRAFDVSFFTPKENKVKNLFSAIYCLALIYSIFVPLKRETMLFSAGLVIFILGLVFYAVATINYVTTPLDEPITKGVYKISRHPIYFFHDIAFVGVCIASASWVLLLLFVLYNRLHHITIKAEERFLLDKFGDAYREYMSKTPRYFLFF